MNGERVRELLKAMAHVIEAEQFGGLIYWVGDKAIGGKMCVMLHPERGAVNPVFYPAGEERFHELCELDGVVPAPYLARLFWVAVERWDVFREAEWEAELRAAHAVTLNKLPLKTRTILASPKAEQKRLVAERRKLLFAREAAKKAAGQEASGAASKRPRKLKR